MLATGKQLLDKANAEGYAVGAFNFSNLEILKAIIAAAEVKKSPVMVQTSEGAISYAGLHQLMVMAHQAAKEASVPVALHLDHGTTYETIIGCIAAGWTSVMVDGSHHNLERNIEVTQEIVKVAHAVGISVEAELGRLSGVEDQISVDEKDALYTNPQEAKAFVEATGIDSLAVAIGNAHGKYKGVPKLDFERLSEIKAVCPLPLVLHGSSGLTEDAIKEAVSRGVNKINIDTDLRVAFTDAIRKTLDADADVFDPRKVIGPSMKAIQAVVEEKIEMFGSANRA